jgi:hypothetical protein
MNQAKETISSRLDIRTRAEPIFHPDARRT